MTKRKQEQADKLKGKIALERSVPILKIMCFKNGRRKRQLEHLLQNTLTVFLSLSQEPTIPKIYIINKKINQLP